MAAEGPQVAPGASSTPVPALVASVPNPKGAAMTAVILTAEQAAQVLAGVREFVVPGNITDGAVTLWKWDEGKPVRHPWRIVAPQQWADADGQRVELRGPCDCSKDRPLDPVCPSFMSVAWATVEVLPFRKWASHLDTPPGRWATMTPTGRLVIQSCDSHTLTSRPTNRQLIEPFPAPDRHFVGILSDVQLATQGSQIANAGQADRPDSPPK